MNSRTWKNSTFSLEHGTSTDRAQVSQRIDFMAVKDRLDYRSVNGQTILQEVRPKKDKSMERHTNRTVKERAQAS